MRCAKLLPFIERIGMAHSSTIHRRFGSWPKALRLAGLEASRSQIGIPNEELFDNNKSLWISLVRQPKYCEANGANSRFSASTYEKRFGSWASALREFVLWVNSDASDQLQQHGG